MAAQELYKWTDENGNVHYGDQPPAKLENQSNVTEVATRSKRNTIAKIPVSVDASEAVGISRYVLKANELFSSHSSTPSRIIISDGILWLPFQGSVLSFDPSSGKSTKHKLDRIQAGLQAQRMHISGDSFIFLAKDRRATTSTFHVYDHVTDSHNELAVVTTPTNIVAYDDKYGDGIFGFSYHNKSLIQYPNVLSNEYANAVSEVERSLVGDISGINGLSASRNAIWYISGYKKSCAVGFYDKRGEIAKHFSSNEIGGSSSNGCLSIVADDREAWVTSPEKNRVRTTFSIYDIKNAAWETLEKGENDPDSYAVSLQMDKERVYYTRVDKIFAVDRESRRTTVLSLDGPDRADQHTYGINLLRVHDGYIWALKFETYNHRRYPVLYKIPSEKMNRQH